MNINTYVFLSGQFLIKFEQEAISIPSGVVLSNSIRSGFAIRAEILGGESAARGDRASHSPSAAPDSLSPRIRSENICNHQFLPGARIYKF